MSDLWHWRAVYRDGSTLDEYDPAGDHGLADVDQSKLVEFWLLPQYPHLLPAVVRLTHPESRLIFFRRRNATLSDGSNNGTGVHSVRTLHVLGVQRGEGDGMLDALTFLFPDGSMIVSDDSEATNG